MEESKKNNKIMIINIEDNIFWFPEIIDSSKQIMVYEAKNIKVNRTYNLTDIYEVSANYEKKSLITRLIDTDLKINRLDLANLTELQKNFHNLYLYEWVYFGFFLDCIKEYGSIPSCGKEYEEIDAEIYYKTFLFCRRFIFDIFDHQLSEELKNVYLGFVNPFILFWKEVNRKEILDYNIIFDDVKTVERILEITEEFLTPEDTERIHTLKIKEQTEYLNDIALNRAVPLGDETTFPIFLDSVYTNIFFDRLSNEEIETRSKNNKEFRNLAEIYIKAKEENTKC